MTSALVAGLIVAASGRASAASPTRGASETPGTGAAVVISAPIIGSAEHDGCCPIRFTAMTNDDRASGEVYFPLQSIVADAGDFTGAFEFGVMTLTNDAGVWEGWCGGGGWRTDATYADVSCWLAGSGDYDGMTYYQHLSVRDPMVEISGVILPIPLPDQ